MYILRLENNTMWLATHAVSRTFSFYCSALFSGTRILEYTVISKSRHLLAKQVVPGLWRTVGFPVYTIFLLYCSFALFGPQIQICCSVPPEPWLEMSPKCRHNVAEMSSKCRHGATRHHFFSRHAKFHDISY